MGGCVSKDTTAETTGAGAASVETDVPATEPSAAEAANGSAAVVDELEEGCVSNSMVFLAR